MSQRACILQYDRTTAQGVVLDGLDDVAVGERKISYLGARVQCPVCKSIGQIVADGPRAVADEFGGRQPALENDLCRCGCQPPPRLLASQRVWTFD